jgi:murein DD-endopeptidase MepM/ murein hydrolase activator NlpD
LVNSFNPLNMPTVQPVAGFLTSGFGQRGNEFHAGTDVGAPIGTPILAASSGKVIDAGPVGGFGQWVRIRHDDGTVSIYGHINDWTVSVGQRVRAGELIAHVGNKGQSTGPHLHFEVRDAAGRPIDSMLWLIRRGALLLW